MPGNLVAIYQDPRSADLAVRDLLDIGIPRDRIHLSHRPDPMAAAGDLERDRARDRENRGSAMGAIVGGIAGAVLFGFLTVILAFLPGMEWILGQGDLATILGAIAVGALLGVVAGGLGVPLRRPGGNVEIDRGRDEQVVVEVSGDHDRDRVIGVLSRHDPVEIEQLGPRPVEPVEPVEPVAPAASRRGLLSDVEIRERQTRDRDRDPTR